MFIENQNSKSIVCGVNNMLLGVNEHNEIIAINDDITEELTVIEVDNDTFGDNEPTNFKIRIGEGWQELTPRYQMKGIGE